MTTEHESAPTNDPEGIEEPDTSQAAAEAVASVDEPAAAEEVEAPAAPEPPQIVEEVTAPLTGEPEIVAPDVAPIGAESTEAEPAEIDPEVDETTEVAVVETDVPITPDATESLVPVAAESEAEAEEEKEIFIRAERPAIVAKSVSDLPDELLAEDFAAAIEQTVLEFKEGDIVEGTVASIDQDEVLVDIGYKSEGHIPLKELSIRHSVNPLDVVAVGDRIEALVLDKEDDEGRLILSKKRAQYERGLGSHSAGPRRGRHRDRTGH